MNQTPQPTGAVGAPGSVALHDAPRGHGTRRVVLLRGGSVYSPAAPFATALLVVDGQVAWVGEEDAAESHAESADDVVHLAGRLVTPGFVDAHVHLAQTGFALASLDLSHAASLAEALAELERFARHYSGRLLRAHGWDESRWPEARRMTGARARPGSR